MKTVKIQVLNDGTIEQETTLEYKNFVEVLKLARYMRTYYHQIERCSECGEYKPQGIVCRCQDN